MRVHQPARCLDTTADQSRSPLFHFLSQILLLKVVSVIISSLKFRGGFYISEMSTQIFVFNRSSCIVSTYFYSIYSDLFNPKYLA